MSKTFFTSPSLALAPFRLLPRQVLSVRYSEPSRPFASYLDVSSKPSSMSSSPSSTSTTGRLAEHASARTRRLGTMTWPWRSGEPRDRASPTLHGPSCAPHHFTTATWTIASRLPHIAPSLDLGISSISLKRESERQQRSQTRRPFPRMNAERGSRLRRVPRSSSSQAVKRASTLERPSEPGEPSVGADDEFGRAWRRSRTPRSSTPAFAVEDARAISNARRGVLSLAVLVVTVVALGRRPNARVHPRSRGRSAGFRRDGRRTVGCNA